MNEIITFLFGDGSVIVALDPFLTSLVVSAALRGLSNVFTKEPERLPGSKVSRGFVPQKPTFLQGLFGAGAQLAPLAGQQISNRQATETGFQNNLALLNARNALPIDSQNQEILSEFSQDPFFSQTQVPQPSVGQQRRVIREQVGTGLAEQENQDVLFALNQLKEQKAIDAPQKTFEEDAKSEINTQIKIASDDISILNKRVTELKRALGAEKPSGGNRESIATELSENKARLENLQFDKRVLRLSKILPDNTHRQFLKEWIESGLRARHITPEIKEAMKAKGVDPALILKILKQL